MLSKIRTQGVEIDVRGNKTKEIQTQFIELTHPLERCLVLPKRNNNIFATIAETMWVLSGRSDLDFLGQYLKRAHEFSDDGRTWRAGYGGRLRNWNGIDQLSQVRKILASDFNSRRAVISLFDPDRDFVESNDIPCNNWLHFMCRDGKLHLNVAARSTDIVWGFSGINAFEWSILQEIMAYWLGIEVGSFGFFTSSLHIYERHYGFLHDPLGDEGDQTIYHGDPYIPRFATKWEDFDHTIGEWFTVEEEIRTGQHAFELKSVTFHDPLLLQFIQMMDIYWSHQRQMPRSLIEEKIKELNASDLSLAATEFINRMHNT